MWNVYLLTKPFSCTVSYTQDRREHHFKFCRIIYVIYARFLLVETKSNEINSSAIK